MWLVGLPSRRQIAMTQKPGSFMSGAAAFSRSVNGRLTLMKHKNALALLKAQLILPIQTYLEIASTQCEIDLELQDPKLREIYGSIELSIPSELTTTIQPADFAVAIAPCSRHSGWHVLLLTS
jgi:ABC-type tungstate transport system substrate-binding protein